MPQCKSNTSFVERIVNRNCYFVVIVFCMCLLFIGDYTLVALLRFICSTWTELNSSSEHLYSNVRPIKHTFNGPLSGTNQVSRYQKGKTNLDFTGARDSEWQWHQVGHMQVCTSLQTDNHASTPPLGFYRPDALPAAQSTASKH